MNHFLNSIAESGSEVWKPVMLGVVVAMNGPGMTEVKSGSGLLGLRIPQALLY